VFLPPYFPINSIVKYSDILPYFPQFIDPFIIPYIEYGMANKVSSQGDVYSYEILLLEMFTGKRPTDHAFTEGLSIPKFVEMAFPV